MIELETESRLISFVIGYYNWINSVGKLLYHSIIRPKIKISTEAAHFNIDKFVKEEILRYLNTSKGMKKSADSSGLEEKLGTFGDYYIPREQFYGQLISTLWQAALQYDFKGIVPSPNDNADDFTASLENFVYRGNTLLFVHKQLKRLENEPEIKSSKNDNKINLGLKYSGPSFVSIKDMEEANKRIPHFMDLTWVATYIKNKKDFIVPALGLTFTLPEYNGMNFIQILSEYKSREQFISVLAHEMTHAGTVYLDTKSDFLETKAYAVGQGDKLLGEYVVAVNANAPLFTLAIRLIENYIIIPLPKQSWRFIPKLLNGARIMINTKIYDAVRNELNGIYGNNGGYVLGRLNADEMVEFRYTNDIPARIAMKDDLKWKIMRTNLANLCNGNS